MKTSDRDNLHPYQPTQCPRCQASTEKNIPFCGSCQFDLRHGSPKRRKTGTCIYCGKYRKFSGEHIFPNWLSAQYPRRSLKTLHHLNRPENYKVGEKSKIHGVTEFRQGDPYIEKVWNVCAPCNNGWMSKLQNEAKPLIKIFAEGGWTNLSETECKLLARWATMVSINFQCHARLLNATKYQRTTLMEGSMPSGWKISIGSMITTEDAGHSFHRSIQVPTQIEEGKNLLIDSAYFCIERVAFHTLSSIADQLLNSGMKYGIGKFILPMRGIWPFDPLADQTVGCVLMKEDLVAIQQQLGY